MAGLVELLGAKLQSKDGEVSTADAVAGKDAVALYFSAHWCAAPQNPPPPFPHPPPDLILHRLPFAFVSCLVFHCRRGQVRAVPALHAGADRVVRKAQGRRQEL